jgi:hypothetical protein
MKHLSRLPDEFIGRILFDFDGNGVVAHEVHAKKSLKELRNIERPPPNQTRKKPGEEW